MANSTIKQRKYKQTCKQLRGTLWFKVKEIYIVHKVNEIYTNTQTQTGIHIYFKGKAVWKRVKWFEKLCGAFGRHLSLSEYTFWFQHHIFRLLLKHFLGIMNWYLQFVIRKLGSFYWQPYVFVFFQFILVLLSHFPLISSVLIPVSSFLYLLQTLSPVYQILLWLWPPILNPGLLQYKGSTRPLKRDSNVSCRFLLSF